MADAAVLDSVFWALSDATRRDVMERLSQGPATVSELAQGYGMSLPGFMKHLRVLEDAGLVQRAKEGRTVTCELAPVRLEDAAMWLSHYEKFWDRQLDRLGRFLYHEEETNPWQRTQSQKSSRTTKASGSRAATPRPRKGSGKRGPTRKPSAAGSARARPPR